MDMREKQSELDKKLGVPPGIEPGSLFPGNPASTKSKSGCLVKLTLIVLLAILVLVGIFYLYPLATPDKIRGDIIDCALVPQKDGSNRLWILTDGSFNYISTTKSPGHYSTGRKCKFCKAWLYEYDPLGGKVIRRIKIPYKDIIIRTSMFYNGDKIWHVADGYHLDEPKIQNFDVLTGTMVEDTAGFVSRHPMLAAGIVKASYDEKKDLITLDTKDGRTGLIYSLHEQKLYPSYSLYHDEQRKDVSEREKFLLCAEGGQDTRKLLYRVKAAYRELMWNESMLQNNCDQFAKKIPHRNGTVEARQISDTVFFRPFEPDRQEGRPDHDLYRPRWKNKMDCAAKRNVPENAN
ncbi:MAG: hypothetical protein CVU51_14780 [Deltaproteobacteria bacterium HGW-Deltaproteobacteria-1]|nr:MAG: hypothetical protein CVU51_14780 [Deltaproteobacteria bacterium HGW-Deltaproteobacteria-1]